MRTYLKNLWIAKAMKYPVATQLLVEMWAPLFLALGWTAYNLYQDAGLRNLKGSVTVFGPTFFLICWGYSQWLRVKKQLRVEGGLTGIEGRLEASIRNFDEKTAEVISRLTGGDGFCYLTLLKGKGTYFENKAVLIADSSYSLFDLEVTIQEKTDKPHDWNNPFEGKSTHRIGELKPNQASLKKFDLEFDNISSRYFFIDFYARNGRWRQELLIVSNPGEERSIATRVERDQKILYEYVDHDFPRNAAGNVDWILKLKLNKVDASSD
ncbi:MAG: hypothetical protein V4454_15845 [Pseudomonadota bacterium]